MYVPYWDKVSSSTRGNMTGNGFTDFITFVSPVFVVAVFFLCLFRFLFRCCSCDRSVENSNNANGQGIMNVRPTPDHEGEDSVGPFIMIRSPALHPATMSDYYGHSLPFITAASIMDRAMLEDPFPPKYDDALKMAAPLPPNMVMMSARGNAAGNEPPPFYENAIRRMSELTGSYRERTGRINVPNMSRSSISAAVDHPPAYSISTISASVDSASTPNLHTSIPQPEDLDSQRPSSSFSHSSAIATVAESAVDHSAKNKAVAIHIDTSSEDASPDLATMKSPRAATTSESNYENQDAGRLLPSRNSRFRGMTASLSTFVPKGSAQKRKHPPKIEEECQRPRTTDAVVAFAIENEQSSTDSGEERRLVRSATMQSNRSLSTTQQISRSVENLEKIAGNARKPLP
ncbi:hypothetical protein Ddc_08715 [Ditylenchus destructor]|nr:hypothetical protein Ddc_08715 [Ditylenchus destructor]